jgi:hypothetical protein
MKYVATHRASQLSPVNCSGADVSGSHQPVNRSSKPAIPRLTIRRMEKMLRDFEITAVLPPPLAL